MPAFALRRGVRLNASVVLPVRDGRAHLDACLDSLGRQTLPGWELVVVDDGSVDDSAAHIQRWSQAEGVELTLIRTPPRGVAAALAAGCEVARGEILIRMDADDVCAPARIERQLDALSRDLEIALVSSLAEPLGDVGSGTDRLHRWQNSLLTDAAMKADLFVDAPFPHSAVALPADIGTPAGRRTTTSGIAWRAQAPASPRSRRSSSRSETTRGGSLGPVPRPARARCSRLRFTTS